MEEMEHEYVVNLHKEIKQLKENGLKLSQKCESYRQELMNQGQKLEKMEELNKAGDVVNDELWAECEQLKKDKKLLQITINGSLEKNDELKQKLEKIEEEIEFYPFALKSRLTKIIKENIY